MSFGGAAGNQGEHAVFRVANNALVNPNPFDESLAHESAGGVPGAAARTDETVNFDEGQKPVRLRGGVGGLVFAGGGGAG